MREYFQNARVIYNEARRALDLSERSEKSLAVQFRELAVAAVQRGIHGFERPALCALSGATGKRSGDILRLFEFVARHGVPLAAETERRLETVASVRALLRHAPRICGRR